VKGELTEMWKKTVTI